MEKFPFESFNCNYGGSDGQKSFHSLVAVSPEIKASRRTICFMTSHHIFLCRLSNNAWRRIVLAYLALSGREKGSRLHSGRLILCICICLFAQLRSLLGQQHCTSNIFKAHSHKRKSFGKKYRHMLPNGWRTGNMVVAEQCSQTLAAQEFRETSLARL